MWGAGVGRPEREVGKAGGRAGRAVGFLPRDSGGGRGMGFLPGQTSYFRIVLDLQKWRSWDRAFFTAPFTPSSSCARQCGAFVTADEPRGFVVAVT